MSDLNAPRGASAPDPSGQADRDVAGQDALAGVLMRTQGPYEVRLCKDLPADCCDYAVVSMSEMREVCRVWREQDARAIAAVLSIPPAAVVTDEAVEAAVAAYFGDATLWPNAYSKAAQADIRTAMRAALAAAPHTRAAIPEGLSPAVLRGLAERRRQIEVEGWTPEHDDTHQAGELARASGCYAIVASDLRKEAMYIHGRWKDVSDLFWPWDRKWWKPSPDPVRNLEKAFALIVAEMERQDRLSVAPTPPSQGGR